MYEVEYFLEEGMNKIKWFERGETLKIRKCDKFKKERGKIICVDKEESSRNIEQKVKIFQLGVLIT